MAKLVITTGLKTYDIADEHDNIRGQISFNPTDMSFFARADEVGDKVQEIIDTLKNGVPTGKLLLEKDREVKELLNYMFGDDNTSDVIFGTQNCFTLLNGVTFIERFLLAFMPVIQEAYEEEKAKSKARLDKYLNEEE